MKIRKETPRDKFICQSGGSFSYLRSNAIARKSKIFERPRSIAYAFLFFCHSIKCSIFYLSLFTFVCLMYQQYNYTFHELRMQLENQVVQIQIQYHKAFQIIWETVVMISGISYQYQKPLTIYLQTKSFTKNTTLLMKK